MPSSTWALALAELIYYIPGTFPVLYCLWKHRKVGIAGWLFLTAFLLLQVVGGGLTLSAGEDGTPSPTAITITSVGMSPLLLAIAGVIHEWTKLAGLVESKRRQKLALLCKIVFHLAVIASIAIYATGASHASLGNDDSAVTEWKTGIVLLLVLCMALGVAFALLAQKASAKSLRTLVWSISVSLALMGTRIVYQCVATFKENRGSFDPVRGSIALRVVFQFVISALVLLALITGGIMSLEHVATRYADEEADIPLHSADARALGS